MQHYYCLRGLESYLSPAVHTDLTAYRAGYVQAVLKEQSRSLHNDAPLADRIRPHVSHMTQWATKRAQRLAVLDAQEAQQIHSCGSVALNWNMGRSCVSRRHSCVADLPSNVDQRRRMMQRESTPPDSPTSVVASGAKSVFENTAPGVGSTCIASADLELAKLGRRNQMLLHRINLQQQQQRLQTTNTCHCGRCFKGDACNNKGKLI